MVAINGAGGGGVQMFACRAHLLPDQRAVGTLLKVRQERVHRRAGFGVFQMRVQRAHHIAHIADRLFDLLLRLRAQRTVRARGVHRHIQRGHLGHDVRFAELLVMRQAAQGVRVQQARRNTSRHQSGSVQLIILRNQHRNLNTGLQCGLRFRFRAAKVALCIAFHTLNHGAGLQNFWMHIDRRRRTTQCGQLLLGQCDGS